MYKPKFLKNDPGNMILRMVFKLFVTMCLFIIIGYFLIGLNKPTLIWSCFYIAFAAISCSKGSSECRRKIFVQYSIAFIIAILIAGIIHPYFYAIIFSIIIGSFFAYWVRRFGAMYMMFPSFILICYMISAIQLPIEKGGYIQALTGMILAGGLFYLIVLKWLPWDMPKQLKQISENFLKDVYVQVRKSLHDTYPSKKGMEQNEQMLLEQSHSFHDKGSLWIIRPERKDNWLQIWSDMDAIIRRFFIIIRNKPEITQKDLQRKYHHATMIALLMLRNLFYSKNRALHLHYQEKLLAYCEEIAQHLMKFECETYIPDIELLACYDTLASLRKLSILLSLMKRYIREV
ncbi:hypothetical protein N8865_01675 [Francisellaceae bacterium]|nr:hypothetical protein [Francisellaceae bacterium]MDA7742301.1 hypothetical protein [Francisellaceae bacterium]